MAGQITCYQSVPQVVGYPISNLNWGHGTPDLNRYATKN